MRFSFMALLRLALFAALGATLLAIQVARLAPHTGNGRFPRRGAVVGLPGLVFDDADDSTRFFDTATGAVRRLNLPEGQLLDDAVCSPWQDAQGASHVVGRWRNAEGRDGRVVLTDLGLACFAYPTGAEVGKVSFDVLPQGGACWYPGTVSRVLFAGADGVLYHVSFEGTPDSRGATPDRSGPVPLRWDVAPPGDEMMLRDPCWPRVPGFEHTVVVSLRAWMSDSDTADCENAQLWWLRLNPAGTAVVNAGRLTTLGPVDRDELAPAVAVTRAGLAAAYLTGPTKSNERQLEVAPVRFDAQTGAPRITSDQAVRLAEHCAPAPLGFSPDGRRVAAVVRAGRSAVIRWFHLPEDWPTRAAARGD